MGSSGFDKLFSMNVPHILEKIFFSLDYESYKKCLEVSYAWNKLLESESYQKKLKEELDRDHEKFWINLTSGTLGGCSEAIIAVRTKSPISTGNAAEGVWEKQINTDKGEVVKKLTILQASYVHST